MNVAMFQYCVFARVDFVDRVPKTEKNHIHSEMATYFQLTLAPSQQSILIKLNGVAAPQCQNLISPI